MSRFPDWQARLVAYLAGIAARPLDYGVHDCGLGLAAGAVEAMTGIDHAAPFRGRYTTLRGGLRILRKAGYANHVEYAALVLGREVHPAFAQMGDICVVPDELTGGQALGVVQGEGLYVLTPQRLGVVPRQYMARAFGV